MARILVVEDEPAIAELVSLNLRHDGHEVQVAGSSQDACSWRSAGVAMCARATCPS